MTEFFEIILLVKNEKHYVSTKSNSVAVSKRKKILKDLIFTTHYTIVSISLFVVGETSKLNSKATVLLFLSLLNLFLSAEDRDFTADHVHSV